MLEPQPANCLIRVNRNRRFGSLRSGPTQLRSFCGLANRTFKHYSDPEPLASSTLFPFFERNIEEKPTTPFQNLINALLLNTPIQSSSAMTDGTKELRINAPTNFTANRDDLDNFIQDCSLCMTLNGTIYNTDEKKIIFMLSFMTEGTA